MYLSPVYRGIAIPRAVISMQLWNLYAISFWPTALRILAGYFTFFRDLGYPLWRHAMETLSSLLALCEGNPPVVGRFPSKGPGNADFDVFFGVSLIKGLNKPSSCWWFETPWCSWWRYYDAIFVPYSYIRPRRDYVVLQRIFSVVILCHVMNVGHYPAAISSLYSHYHQVELS